MAKRQIDKTEFVAVLSYPGEEEYVPFRVTVGCKQLQDLFTKGDYYEEVMSIFFEAACREAQFDMKRGQIDFFFSFLKYDPKTIKMPRDLLKVRPGMSSADITNGQYLLH